MTNNKTTETAAIVNLHVAGPTVRACVLAIGLTSFTTDDLLQELQARGYGNMPAPSPISETVSEVDPRHSPSELFSPTKPIEGEVILPAPAAQPAKRGPGRPRKNPLPVAEPTPEPVPAAQEDDWASNEPIDHEPAPGAGTRRAYTEDDVRDALNRASTMCGLVTVRAKMSELTGSSKLVDIPEAKFGELIAGLNKMVIDAEANRTASQAA
jgi:hypothetical protein